MGLEQQTEDERSEWMSIYYRKGSHRTPDFLGYNATGQKGLEGALRATETSCVPLLENQALTMVS